MTPPETPLECVELELLGTPIQGPQGEQGLRGPNGTVGPAGPTGATGPQGLKGDKGDMGAQGIPGDVGATPVLSVSANDLPNGTPASASISGIYPNLTMEFGLPRGPQGNQGIQGAQGIQGPKGDKGDQGDQGPIGNTGAPGSAATTPNFVFDVTTGAAGSDADLDVSGTYPDLTLNFTIPRGSDGPSGVTTFGDGSAALPSIVFASDPDTGIYRLAANVVGITTGGAQRARFNQDGLTVTGEIASSGNITENGSRVWTEGRFNPALYAPLAGAAFTGSVLVRLASSGSTEIAAGDATYTGFVGFNNSSGGRNGYIGYASAAGAIQYVSNAGGHAFTGNITATGTITASSDRKLKSEIIDLNQEEQLQNIRNMYPAEYIKNGKPDFGVIAQDLQGTAFDRLVSEIDEEGTLGVNYIGLIAPMIAAMKAMAARIEQLEAKI